MVEPDLNPASLVPESLLFKIILLIYVVLVSAMLGLCCCTRLFLVAMSNFSCGTRASHCSAFSCCGAQGLGRVGTVAVVSEFLTG